MFFVFVLGKEKGVREWDALLGFFARNSADVSSDFRNHRGKVTIPIHCAQFRISPVGEMYGSECPGPKPKLFAATNEPQEESPQVFQKKWRSKRIAGRKEQYISSWGDVEGKERAGKVRGRKSEGKKEDEGKAGNEGKV